MAFFSLNIGVLKFQNPTAICFYISNVLFTAFFISMSYFLPLFGKVVFPRSVPFSFIFPPWVAVTTSFMRPMINSFFSALRN